MNTEIKKKAVIYCRVSTKEQVEEGNSLVTQERNCREYAKKFNFEIVQVFIEEGESAKTADRTELQKLLRFCAEKKHQIKAIIIYKIDRLSRNTDDYSQLRILLKRYGVEIKSTSEYFENTPAGRFMENIIANVAQFDNDVRTERSIGGMKNAALEGRYVWVAPVGYTNQKVDGKVTIVQTEKAPLVKMAFELMAEKKYSVNAIYDTMLTLGLTSKFGKPISKSAFYTMLKNMVYAGWIIKFGESHKGTFEPIVSQELFARVQQVMRNKKSSLVYKKENPDFPLRRFICDAFNHKLTGAWSKGRNKSYAYYRFVGTRSYWSKEELESQFYSFMDEFAFSEDLLIKLKNAISHNFSSKSTNKEGDIKILNKTKQELKKKQSALIEKNINGIISDALLKEQLTTLDEQLWKIDTSMLQRTENKVNLDFVLDEITQFLTSPSRTWREQPLDIKLKLQWFQFPEGVTFDGNKFRTDKISSIFKLKNTFLDDLSCIVPLTGSNYEHHYSTNSPPLQKEKAIAWDEIKTELITLRDVLQSTAPDPPL